MLQTSCKIPMPIRLNCDWKFGYQEKQFLHYFEVITKLGMRLLLLSVWSHCLVYAGMLYVAVESLKFKLPSGHLTLEQHRNLVLNNVTT